MTHLLAVGGEHDTVSTCLSKVDGLLAVGGEHDTDSTCLPKVDGLLAWRNSLSLRRRLGHTMAARSSETEIYITGPCVLALRNYEQEIDDVF